MAEAAPTLWQRLWYTRLRDAVRGRFDASLDWRRVLADANLPDELRPVIHETVRATRLWQSEKVDITRELVTHFQDGLDRGRQAPVLVATFGDPKQTSALIRRAKKRGRPILWHVWHYGWISLVALLLTYVLTGLWMMTDRPSIKVDYLAIFNERPRAVPEAERAWPLYREALLAMGAMVPPGNFDPFNAIPEVDAKPGDPDWPKMEQHLRDHADSIAQLRAAAGRRDLGFVTSNSFAAFTPEDRELFGVSVTKEDIEAFKSQTVEDRWIISTLLPYLQQLRTAAQLLASDARRAALAGDADAAKADVVALLGVSRHCQETPFLVNFLVANAVQSIACVTIQDTFADHPQLWSDSQLRDLAHAVSAARVDWRQGFTGETAGFYDTMQRLYTDDGHGDGRLAFRSSMRQNVFELLDSITGTAADNTASFYANDGFAMLMLPAANVVVASRKEMTETYETFINSARTKVSTPLWEQEELAPLDEALLSDEVGFFEKYRYMFVRLLLPAYDMLRNRVASTDGKRDGVLVGMALELYHREQGAWPKALAELSPRWLPSVPVDRINGGPLGYKIVAGQPLVYSLGNDGRDDGGRPPFARPEYADTYPVQPPNPNADKGDWVIWTTVPPEAAPKWESEYGGGESE